MERKWTPQFYRPYQINKKINQVAYNLSLLDKSRIHNFFHVSCFKEALGKYQVAQKTRPTLDDEGKIILEPKAITTREKI